MVRRAWLFPAVVGILMISAVFAGCLEEEEKPPKPEPRVDLTGPAEAWVGEDLAAELTEAGAPVWHALDPAASE